MATIKYTEESPYKNGKSIHQSDFKYKRYLENSGTKQENTKDVPFEEKKFGVALFGIGRAGFIHVVNIMSNPRLKLKYIVEFDVEKARKLQRKYGLDESVVLSLSEDTVAFNDSSVDGIVIATPTKSHESLVIKGLEAGKAVMCEKPISNDQSGVERCYKVAKRVGKPLFCAFNKRFEPSFAEIFNQVRNGNVGRVHLMKAVARDATLPSVDYVKISGGIFQDSSVHDIDLICWMLGEYPEKVFATGTSFIPEIEEAGDFDTVAILLMFPSKAIGMIDMSRNSVYGHDQRIEVFGPKGMLKSSNERPFLVNYSYNNGETLPPIYQSFPSQYENSYVLELERFVEVMAGKSDDYPSAEDVVNVSKIAAALDESAKTGKLLKFSIKPMAIFEAQY